MNMAHKVPPTTTLVVKKRPSIESCSAKRSKSETCDELYAKEDVDLRQQCSSFGSQFDSRLKPLNPNQPLSRPPFMNPPIMRFDEEKPPPHPFDMKNKINESDDHNIMVNCLNRNNKLLRIYGKPRDIVFYDDICIAFMTWEDPREISFEVGSRKVIFDYKDSYILSFNKPYKDIRYNGHVHKVRLGVPTREICIDGQYYECHIGGPGIKVYLFGQAVNVKIEGPVPQVVIGTKRRTDIVAGKANLIIDAKTIIPVYLDAKVQKFKLNGNIHSLKFINALQTVLIDDVLFNIQFGGFEKLIFINNEEHFIRFSVLPRGIKPGYIKIRDMEGNMGFDNTSDLNSQPKKVLRVGDISSDSNSNSPNTTFQQPNLGNLDTLISNVVEETYVQPQNENNTSGYQNENNQHLENNTEKDPSVASFNINDLFQKLVAAGIVNTSTIAQNEVATTNAQNSSNQSIIGSSTKINSSVVPLTTMITLPSTISTPLITKAPINIDNPLMSHKKHSPTPSNVSSIPSSNKFKKKETSLKLVDFSKRLTLQERQPNLIMAMYYTGTQCSSLDWHLRQNRRRKMNIRNGSSRRWYYWHNYEEIEDLDERAEKCYFKKQEKEQNGGSNEEVEIPSISADPNVRDARCEVCFERFELYYNEEKEEWHLRKAIRTENNLTYHPLCYEDYQKSLITSSLWLIRPEESKENGIPGLEVDLNNSKNKESVDSDIKISEEKKEVKDELSAENDDDDVILNEVQPETIVLDEYEFEGNVDNDGILQEIIVKQEPEDGLTDVENFKLGDVKIKTEPNTSDDMIEDVDELDQEIMDVSSKELPEAVHPEFVPSMDGNVELNIGVPPRGIRDKIKINILKQLPVKVPEENKYKSLKVENSTVEPIELAQPPLQLNLKPALQGIELKKLPPVNKDSELTGFCSIM